MSNKQENTTPEKFDFFSKLLVELRDNMLINLSNINKFVNNETPKVIEATGKMNDMYPDMYNVLSKYITSENERTAIMADMLINQHAVQLLVVGKLDDLANLKQLFDNLFSIILYEDYRDEFIKDIQKYKENPDNLTGGGGISTSLLSSNKFTQTVMLLFFCMCVNGFATEDVNPFAYNITPTMGLASSSSLSASGDKLQMVTIGKSNLGVRITNQEGVEVKQTITPFGIDMIQLSNNDKESYLALMTRTNELLTKVNNSQAELKDAQEELINEKKNFKNEIEKLKAELSLAEGSEKKNHMSIQELESDLEKEKQESTNKIQELESKIQELESNLEKENQDSTNNVKVLESEIQKLKLDLEKEKQESTNKIQELESNLATAKTENKELESENQDLESEKQMSTSKIEELKTKILNITTESTAKIQELEKNLETAKSNLEILQTELETNNNHLSNLENKLKEIEQELSDEKEQHINDFNELEEVNAKINATNYLVEVIYTYKHAIQDLQAKNEYLTNKTNITKLNESSKELVASNYGITVGTSHDIYRAYILEPSTYDDYDPTITDFVAKLKTYNGLLIVKNVSAEVYTKAFNEMTEAANNVVNTDYTQVIEFPYLNNDDTIYGLIDLIQNYSSRLNTKNASLSCDTVFNTVNYLETKSDIFRFPTNAYSGLSIFQWATEVISGTIIPIFTDPFHISNTPSQIPDFTENSEEIDKYKGNEINTVISAFSNAKMKTGCQQFPDPNIKIKLEYVQKEPATNWKEWVGDNFKALQGDQNHTVKFVRMKITGRLSSAKVGSLITQLTNTITKWERLKTVVLDQEKDASQLTYSLRVIDDIIQNCELMLEYIFGLMSLGEIFSNENYEQNPTGLINMLGPVARFIGISEKELKFIGETLPKDKRVRERLLKINNQEYNVILFDNISKAYNYAITALSDINLISINTGEKILKFLGGICIVVFIFMLNSTFAFFKPLLYILIGIFNLFLLPFKGAWSLMKKGQRNANITPAPITPAPITLPPMPPLIMLEEEWRKRQPPLPEGTPPPPMPPQSMLEEEWRRQQLQRRGGKKLNKTRVIIKTSKTRKQKRRAKKQTKRPRKQRRYTRKRNVRK